MSAKRDDIIHAAIRVFNEAGLKGARMEQIAQTAEVSKRTLYKYFGGKEAIFEEICSIVIAELTSMRIPSFDEAAPIEEQLLAILSAYFSQTLAAKNLQYSRVILIEFMQNPVSAKVFKNAFASVDDPITQFIADAMKARRLQDSDPRAAMRLLLALFKSETLLPAIWNQIDMPVQQEIEAIKQESVDVFLSRYACT